MDGFPVSNSDEQVLIGLAVCWGERDAYYVSLQREQSKGRHKHLCISKQAHCSSFFSVQCVCIASGLSSSLAPPPLDNDLSVSERLAQVKSCLSLPSVSPRKSVIIAHDIIQVYKALVLSCDISLEGNCEDPTVSPSTG